jgi:ABC-type multidrug transport system fused ATPase/permease subunit
MLQKFDGKDLKGLSLEHVRKHMALVGQEPRLFSGSIRENIAYGLSDVPMKKVEEAALLANAAKFIAGLPDVSNSIGFFDHNYMRGENFRDTIRWSARKEHNCPAAKSSESPLPEQSCATQRFFY